MSQIDDVCRTINFVEDNLLAPINVKSMADVASFSLYYFCRVFSKMTRHTPHDYLIRRRVTEASKTVIATQRKIIDIALDYQFQSHEGFTRAFSRILEISPSNARKQQAVCPLRGLSQLTYNHLVCLQTQAYLIPELVTLSHVELVSIDQSAEFAEIATYQENEGQQSAWSIFEIPFNHQCSKIGHDYGNPKNITLHYARFTLNPDTTHLALVFDWILYTWLFYAPYELVKAQLLMNKSHQHCHIYVPVKKTAT